MPNPFPGMDPYLEGPLWPMVHNNLTEEIARQLSPKLRPKYLARINQRILVATPDPSEFGAPAVRVPDVAVVTSHRSHQKSTAMESSAPLVLDALIPEAIEQTYVEIITVADRRLVTAIEVLSMTNKRGDGLGEYQRKRQEMLASKAHFIEIDLLRAGERFPVVGTLPSAPYFVFLSRASRRPRLEIWPIALEAALPKIGVPLLPGDPDVELDLQLAMQTIYELFSYGQLEDHSPAPPHALSPEQAAWVGERLRAAGMQ
jgi:hypothetical protein